MSVLYIVLMVAVSVVLLFVMVEAVLSVGRKPARQTPQQRLASKGATLHDLPKAAQAPALPTVVVEAQEALAA